MRAKSHTVVQDSKKRWTLVTIEIDKNITQDAMLSFASCFGLHESSAVYVSSPITTGKNYLEWLKLDDRSADIHHDDESLTREVFVTVKNIEQAAELVRKVRDKYTNPVIDPTRLEDVTGWTQNDYHKFWVKLIRKSVSIIVFADGWEYSNGSTLEYICGLEKGLALITHDFQTLTPDFALAKLKSAVDDFREQEVTSEILEDAIRFLESRAEEGRTIHE